MSKLNPCKIEQDHIHPCPCRKQGQLCPITLTEALGCHRCQHIFIIRSDGYTLEQLSGLQPYKQRWYWTGQEWTPVKDKLKANRWMQLVGSIFAGSMFAGLMGLLLCLTRVFTGLMSGVPVVWIVVGILAVCLCAVLAWFTVYRRS